MHQAIFKHFSKDFKASIVVFLVALPLCLGIALASGAPLFSGIISGIIGGVLVGAISGSKVGVSGPAAGLAVIVFNDLQLLSQSFTNYWQIFMLVVVIAGVIQLLAGFAKLGSIAYYFPSSVIKGMLTAIGLIIVLKQIPHALGYDKDYGGDLFFYQNDGQNTFSELLNVLNKLNFPSIVASFVALAILLLWEVKIIKSNKLISSVPAPLVAVVSGIVIGNIFLFDSEHLVQVPIFDSFDSFANSFSLPDFTHLTNPDIYFMALVIAIVASVETLLCVEATDKLDPEKNITPTNQELKAQGIGNIVSGLLGGLPLTQVVVRSSANISFGGKTKMSAILHGLLLLLSAIAIPKYLNMLPLATLAAILIVIGYKLAKPKIFLDTFKLGFEQFLPFLVTIIGMLLTDLLKGVAMGMVVSIIFILFHNFRNGYYRITDFSLKNSEHFIKLADNVSFLNKGAILQMLQHMPDRANVVIDASHCKSIDCDVIEIIENFISTAKLRKINVEVRGSILRKQVAYNVLAEERTSLSKEIRDQLTPQVALQMLKDGNQRFVNNLKINRNLLQQVNETSGAQHPFAIILSCIDSRTSAELIFDQGLGDIFSCRIAGNVLNQDIIGSMEFACKVAGAKLIMVLGHSECGAIKGACDHVKMGNLTSLLLKIRPSVEAEKETTECRNSSNSQFVDRVAKINVNRTINEISEFSEILLDMQQKGEIAIVGGMYDVASGLVELYENLSNNFKSLTAPE
jgi:carbonic anhydrase